MASKNHSSANRGKSKVGQEFPPAPSKALLKDFKDRAAVLVEPALNALGLELVLAQCPMDGGRPVLRLFIDRLPVEGESDSTGSKISLDDCAAASQVVDAVLEDDKGEQPDGYVLEVSSPGLNRPLVKETDFRRFSGRVAKLKLRLDDKAAVYKGHLRENSDGSLAIETAEALIPFVFDQVLSARLSLDDIQADEEDS